MLARSPRLPRELCDHCKKMHYTTNPCAQMIANKSTRDANSIGIRGAASGSPAPRLVPVVRDQGSIQSPRVDTTAPKRGRGRPKTITDMKAYKAAKAREYRASRAEVKAGIRVPKPRQPKGS